MKIKALIKKNKKAILITISGTLIFGAMIAGMILIPAHSRIIHSQQIIVPAAQPVTIKEFDITIEDFVGSQSDFEDMLNNPDTISSHDYSITDDEFNDNISVPNSYFDSNANDDDQLINLVTQPHFVGQQYYSNQEHPAIRINIANQNIFKHQLKNNVKTFNVWPKALKVGQKYHSDNFDTVVAQRHPKKYYNYSDTSMFTAGTQEQNTVVHVSGNEHRSIYNYQWSADYRFNVDPQTHRFSYIKINE